MARTQIRTTTDLRAYEHLLRGIWAHKNDYTSKDNFKIASQYFSKAMGLDAKFTLSLDGCKESEVHRILGAIY